jgi:hypothetical protein
MALTKNYMPLSPQMSAIQTDDGRMMPVGIPPDYLMQQGFTELPSQPKLAENMTLPPNMGPQQSRLDAPPPMMPPSPQAVAAGGSGPGPSVPWYAGGVPASAGGSPPVPGGAVGKPGPTVPESAPPKEVSEPGVAGSALRQGGAPVAAAGATQETSGPVTVSLPSNRVVGYTKGGEQIKTGRKEERTQLAPGTTENIEQASDEQAIAIRNQAAIQGLQSEVQADEFAKQSAELRQQAADAQLREQDVRLEYALRERELAQERQAIDNAEVDPKRYFHDKGALVTVGLAIARAMGAYGAAITHGQNDAAKIIDDGIEQDIQAQRESIARRQQGIAARQTLLERWMDRNDPETSAEKARVLMRDATSKRIESEVARIGTEQARVNGEALIADLQAKNAASMANIQKTDVAESYAYTQPKPIMSGGAQQVQVPPELAEVLRATPREKWGSVIQEWSKTRAAALAKGPGGEGGQQGYGVEGAKNLSLAEGLSRNVDSIRREVKARGRAAIVDAQTPGTVLNKKVTNASDQLGRIRSGAAVTDAEAARFSGLIAGKSGVVSPDVVLKILDDIDSEAQSMQRRLVKPEQEKKNPPPAKTPEFGESNR